MRLMKGDELKMRCALGDGAAWEGVGHVVKMPDNLTEEVGLPRRVLDLVRRHVLSRGRTTTVAPDRDSMCPAPRSGIDSM